MDWHCVAPELKSVNPTLVHGVTKASHLLHAQSAVLRSGNGVKDDVCSIEQLENFYMTDG